MFRVCLGLVQSLGSESGRSMLGPEAVYGLGVSASELNTLGFQCSCVVARSDMRGNLC